MVLRFSGKILNLVRTVFDLCTQKIPYKQWNLRWRMLIKITRSQTLSIQVNDSKNHLETPFPVGEYFANLTPEGKIEVSISRQIKALFSFSQFREKVSSGDFIVIEN
jgi:hypothetical protein